MIHFDNIPWPAWQGHKFVDAIDLSKPSLVDYLDCVEAEPLRQNIIDIVNKHNVKSVLDVGCGDAKLSEKLNVENYYGLEQERHLYLRAFRRYRNHDNRTILYGNKLEDCLPVDCLMFIGSLSYNKNHQSVFDKFVEQTNPKIIIIQEILPDQTYVVPSNNIESVAINLSYYQQLNHNEYIFDLPIWCGKRIQLEIVVAS